MKNGNILLNASFVTIICINFSTSLIYALSAANEFLTYNIAGKRTRGAAEDKSKKRQKVDEEEEVELEIGEGEEPEYEDAEGEEPDYLEGEGALFEGEGEHFEGEGEGEDLPLEAEGEGADEVSNCFISEVIFIL